MYWYILFSSFFELLLTILFYLDDYQSFDGHIRHFDHMRYLVGLFTARVYDTEATRAYDTGNPSEPQHEHYTAQGDEQHVFTPLTTEYVNGTYRVRLNNANVEGRNYTFTVHRLVQVLANHYEITVFNDGNLEDIGLTAPLNSNFDDHITYRPLHNNRHDIERGTMRAIRVGNNYARDCDGDHRLGASTLHYCHGLGHVSALSHRLNICFIHVRRNAGHWCFGLHISEYTDGRTTNAVDTSFVDSISWEGDVPLFEGEPIEETNIFGMLPALRNRYYYDDEEEE